MSLKRTSKSNKTNTRKDIFLSRDSTEKQSKRKKSKTATTTLDYKKNRNTIHAKLIIVEVVR